MIIVHINDKIRLDILEFYYDLYIENSSTYKEYGHFIEVFKIPKNELVGHVRYLHDMQLLDCICTRAVHEYGMPLECKITARGINAIEHPEQFTRDVPFLNLIINSNINNSKIFQAEYIQIDNSFNNVYQEVENSELDVERKKELYDIVKEFELEGKKEKPNFEKMKSLIDAAKNIWSPIYELLKPLIQEFIKAYMGLE